REGRPARILSGDMRLGDVRQVTISGQQVIEPQLLAKFAHIAHLEVIDLDRDGADDFLVAELGSFEPADQSGGKVIWLRWDDEMRRHEPIELATGLGRVADVRAADFDQDGDLDLVVAEFGWHRTGQIQVLWNEQCTASEQKFRREVIDPSPGAIHVPICDLNQDGRPDFVALISQEKEAVVAYLGQADGTFQRQLLWQANDPSYGSSGLELADLDHDGDLDLLFTNGDTFDNMHIKPYHGVQVLWNEGELTFRHQFLAAMPGAYRAVAGDVDADGDVDIVVSAFLPQEPLTEFDASQHHSLVWLERTPDGGYQRHVLEQGNFNHATIVLADCDADGDLDLVVGEFPRAGDSPYPRFRFWWNEGF
ncbi:MAG: FG-GAP repeat domain-containing protein, partial [Planctomycetota bacterium]